MDDDDKYLGAASNAEDSWEFRGPKKDWSRKDGMNEFFVLEWTVSRDFPPVHHHRRDFLSFAKKYYILQISWREIVPRKKLCSGWKFFPLINIGLQKSVLSRISRELESSNCEQGDKMRFCFF